MKKIKAWAVIEAEKRIERTGTSCLYIFTTEKAAQRRVQERSEIPYPNGLGTFPKLTIKSCFIVIPQNETGAPKSSP
jgi:hypothetical protein